MAGAFVQQAKVSVDNSNSANISLTTANFGSSVTSGNLLLVVVRAYGGSTSTPIVGVTSVTDTLGTTYTVRASSNVVNPGMWIYSGVAGSGGTNAVTVVLNNLASKGVYFWVYAAEYSGSVTTYDTSSSNTASTIPSGDITAGTMTTAGAGIIVVAASQGGNSNFAAGTGFTLQDGVIDSLGGVEWRTTSGVQSSFTGHISANATWSFCAIQISFLITVAAAPRLVPLYGSILAQ